MNKKVLVTGSSGFIASHICDYILENTDWEVVGLDRIDCSSSLSRLKNASKSPRFKFVWADLKSPINNLISSEIGKPNIILHFAAFSHVDRSLVEAPLCVMDNVLGTCHLLEYARTLDNLEMIYYQNTDEIFGSATHDYEFQEDDRTMPSNVYSATKSAAGELCVAYHNSFKLPIIAGNLMNCLGERQSAEKYVPLVIKSILQNKNIKIHASEHMIGARNYIYVKNVASVVMFLLNNGISGGKYNIRGQKVLDNLQMAQSIAEIMGKDLNYTLVKFDPKRPAHDLFYNLSGTKLDYMGYKHPYDFDTSLEQTVKFYLDNPEWLS